MAEQLKSSRRIIAGILSVLACVAVLCWVLWPSRIELSSDAYGVALALYRVCNQKDASRLQQIADELDELDSTSGEGVSRLREIVKVASNGQWQVAMRDTRSILDDQTSKR